MLHRVIQIKILSVLKPNFAPYLSCPSQVLCGNKKSMISQTAGYVSIIMIQELYVVGHF